MLQRQSKLGPHLGITRRIHCCIPECTRILHGHTGDITLAVIQRFTNSLNFSFSIPSILENLTSFFVKTRAHKTVNDKATSTWHTMITIEFLRLLLCILLHNASHGNWILIHFWMAHPNEQTHAACQVCIMRMMEIIRLAALHETSCLAQVVRHTCFDWNNVRIGITNRKQRASKLYALAGFHQLSRHETLHCLFVNMVTQQIAMLLRTNQFRVKKHVPVRAHLSTN